MNKSIGLLRTLQKILSRSPLLNIYKSFIQPHLVFGDISYGQAFNNSFYHKFEMIQCNVALDITAVLQEARQEKMIKNNI